MIAGKSVGGESPQHRHDKAWLPCVAAAACFGALIAVWGAAGAAMLLAALLAAAATLKNYRFGLWCLVLLIPISAAPIFPRALFGISGANPFNALFGLTLLSFFAERVSIRKSQWNAGYHRFWWAYLAPVSLAAVIGTQHFSEIPSFAFATGPVHFTTLGGYLRDIFVKPMMYVLLALMLGTALSDGMKPRAIIVAMCLALWLFAAWVAVYVLSSGFGLSYLAGAANREALSGTGMHANDLGNLAALMLILMIYAIAHADRTSLPRWFYLATAGMSAALLLISFSRGAFLAFVVGLTVFFVSQRRVKFLLVGVLVLVCLLPLLPAELFERLSTGLGTGGSMVLHSSDDPLTAGRVAGVWMPLLPEVWAHPFFGNGLFAIAWSEAFRSGAMRLMTLNPHNLYLKMLLEVGVVGLVLILFFFGDMWRRFMRTANDPATPQPLSWLFAGSAAALLGYAAAGMSGGDYLPEPSNFLLWMSWGMLSVFAARRVEQGKARAAVPPAAPSHPARNPG